MTKVVTGMVRFSYAHVFEPHAMNPGQDPKYSVSILIPKDDEVTIKKIKAAVKAAAAEGKDSKFGGKIPKNLKMPLRDGDEEREDDEVYQDHYFITANSSNQPGVVDKHRNEILDDSEFYSGCYGRASVNFYAFSVNGNKGIAVGLNGVQKLKDGPKLGGSTFNAENDFGDDFDFDEEDDMMG